MHVPNSCHRLRQQMVPDIHLVGRDRPRGHSKWVNGRWEVEKAVTLQAWQRWAPMAGQVLGTLPVCELPRTSVHMSPTGLTPTLSPTDQAGQSVCQMPTRQV